MSGKRRERSERGSWITTTEKAQRERGNLRCTGNPDVRSFSGVAEAAARAGEKEQRSVQRLGGRTDNFAEAFVESWCLEV